MSNTDLGTGDGAANKAQKKFQPHNVSTPVGRDR